MKAKRKVDLLIIDPQNDFCDPSGSLYVAGADQDMIRLASMVDRLGTKLHDIHSTLDSHHWVDISHPAFWVDSNGKNPNPLTVITEEDISNGIWRTRYPQFMNHAKKYTSELKNGGKYLLCIWPPHCLIGTPGANVYPEFLNAISKWEKETVNNVNYVTKGSNFLTEHYSAVKAEVEDPNDPFTQLNTQLIQTLQEVDEIVIAGQASSHCVKFTVTDIADNIGDEHIKKFVFLTDASSPVPGFENEADQFIQDMVARGMRTSTTTEYLM